MIIISNIDRVTLHIWDDEWHRWMLAPSKRLRNSCTPEQRRTIAEMTGGVRSFIIL